MPASPVRAATVIRIRTSPFGAKGLRTVHNVGGIATAIASHQGAANIAAVGQGIGQLFENARKHRCGCIKAEIAIRAPSDQAATLWKVATQSAECLLARSLLGAKRTCRFVPHMSAYDPKRILGRFAIPPGCTLVHAG